MAASIVSGVSSVAVMLSAPATGGLFVTSTSMVYVFDATDQAPRASRTWNWNTAE